VKAVSENFLSVAQILIVSSAATYNFLIYNLPKTRLFNLCLMI